MLRRIWISICVLLSFVSAALALSPSEIAVLFNRGIKPAYYANLLTGTLPSWLTFARAGNATQYDATGKLTTAPNNLLMYSNTLSSAPWGGTGATFAAPTLSATSGAGRHHRNFLTSITTGQNFILSVDFEKTNYNYVYLSLYDGGSAWSTAVFDLSAPSASTQTGVQFATIRASGITLISGTRYRAYIAGTWTYSTTPYVSIGFAGAATGNSLADAGIPNFTATGTETVNIYNTTLSVVTYETTPRAGDQVITTSAAYYGPRFDYNPNTLAPLGLLIEGSATNLFLYSGNFGTSWTFANGARTTDTTLASDGVTAAAKITASAGTSTPQAYLTSGNSITASTNYAVSFEIDGSGNSGYPTLIFQGQTGATNWAAAVFNCTTNADGTATQTAVGSSSGTVVSTNQKYLGNGRYRISLVANVGTTGTGYAFMGIARAASGNTFASNGLPSGTYTGTEYIYMAFGQLELGSFTTSYIPTAASTVTRAADIVQFMGGALTTLQGSQGAVIVQMLSEGATNPAANTNILKGTNSILYRDTTGKLGTTNGTTALLTSGTPTWTSVNRVGLSWSPGNRLLNYTAATAANDNNSAANGGTIYLGSNNGSNAENGWYQSFGIYNQPLANSNFQPRLVVGAPY